MNYPSIEMHREHAGRRAKVWGQSFHCWYQQLRCYQGYQGQKAKTQLWRKLLSAVANTSGAWLAVCSFLLVSRAQTLLVRRSVWPGQTVGYLAQGS